jgi:hypothetical protein
MSRVWEYGKTSSGASVKRGWWAVDPCGRVQFLPEHAPLKKDWHEASEADIAVHLAIGAGPPADPIVELEPTPAAPDPEPEIEPAPLAPPPSVEDFDFSESE